MSNPVNSPLRERLEYRILSDPQALHATSSKSYCGRFVSHLPPGPARDALLSECMSQCVEQKLIAAIIQMQ